MIESLRTTQIAFFRFATPSGFLGGAETRYKKYSCKGKSYETICENIVSRYQTLVSSLPRGTVFLHRRPKTEFITGQPWKGQPSNKHHIDRYKRQKWTLHVKTLSVGEQVFKWPTIAIRFNLLQVCPSMPPFVFTVLFLIPSSNFLSGNFNVSLNLVAALNVWILLNFLPKTAPLMRHPTNEQLLYCN